MTLSIIAAIGNQRQIGLNNKLPWKLKSDLQNFKKLTLNNVVIMGRKTFESIGKILPNRINIVITKSNGYKIHGGYVFHDISLAIKTFKDEKIFICGGEEIYKEILGGRYELDYLYITYVDYNGEADTFFPQINYEEWNLISEERYLADENNEYNFCFKIFKNNKKTKISF